MIEQGVKSDTSETRPSRILSLPTTLLEIDWHDKALCGIKVNRRLLIAALAIATALLSGGLLYNKTHS